MELHNIRRGKKFGNNSRSNPSDNPFRSFRNSRDDRRGESTTVTCADCGTECRVPFIPKTDRPVYCSDCFAQNKSQDSGNDRYSRNDRGSRYSRDNRGSRYSRNDQRGESTTVTCADCGTECRVPFIPKTDRPVYCSDCFAQNKSQDSGNDRYSRNDRGSKGSNYQDSRPSRGNFRSKSPKLKSLKKQETFFSGGSDKFYNTLKEKLFEILGGKICSNCGFKDERVLGISHNIDEDSFDSVRRGGFASSWGKYISDPNLARKELKILCLNCNELKKPTSTREEKTKDFKKKKNRFPR